MKTKCLLRGMLLCAACALFLPGLLRADVYLKYRHRTDAFELIGHSQPAEDTVQETWAAKDMLRTDTGDQTIIMRLDRELFYVIDHAEKAYREIPLDFGGKAIEAIDEDEEMDEEEKEHARQFIEGMLEGMQMNIRVAETGEKKKIGGWNCTRYLQTMAVMGITTTADVWITKEIEVDYGLLAGLNAAGMMMMPGMFESLSEVIEEMKKIEGVTVFTLSTSSIMGTEVKSTQELVEHSERKTPAGFFDPPRGYTKLAM